jgi:hypothetical protein
VSQQQGGINMLVDLVVPEVGESIHEVQVLS